MIKDVKKSYLEAIEKIKTVEGEFQALTQKLDDMEAQTSILKSKVESCENEERSVYDSYFLGKVSDKDLTDIRKKVQDAKDALSTHSKMIESLNRCITGKEREVAALRKQVDSLRHQVWSSLFEAKVSTIPETIRAVVKDLVVIGLNCSMGRDFILPKIFVMPASGEIQQIYQKLATSLGVE